MDYATSSLSELKPLYAELSKIKDLIYNPINDRLRRIAQDANPFYGLLSSIKPSLEYYEGLSQIEKIYGSCVIVSDGLSQLILEAEQKQVKIAKSFEPLGENDGFCRRSLEQLGSSGWTIDWHAPLGLYLHTSTNVEDADYKFKRYFTKENLQRIIFNIESFAHNRISREAIMSFHRGCYYACASLLFTAIEKELIHYIHEPDAKNHVYGKLVVKRFGDQIENEFARGTIKESASIGTALSLAEFWKDSPNFDDTPVINRNNLLHGMMKREVTRIDCIKLLLAYNNVLFFTGGTDEP